MLAATIQEGVLTCTCMLQILCTTAMRVLWHSVQNKSILYIKTLGWLVRHVIMFTLSSPGEVFRTYATQLCSLRPQALAKTASLMTFPIQLRHPQLEKRLVEQLLIIIENDEIPSYFFSFYPSFLFYFNSLYSVFCQSYPHTTAPQTARSQKTFGLPMSGSSLKHTIALHG